MNILVGSGIAMTVQVVVFPWFGIHVGMGAHLGLTVIFTVVSFVRSYALRRFFNWLHERRKVAAIRHIFGRPFP